MNVQLRAGLAAVEQLEHFDFQQAQFAVGDDEEVAAAAGGVEKAQARKFLVEAPQFGLVAFDALKFGAQIVQEQRADDFEDVAFAGVMRADLPPLLRLHDGLKERAENGGRNARPVEARAGEQRVAHVAVEIGEAEIFGEQLAVDVGKCGERFVEVLLALLRRRVEHFKEAREVHARVRAVGGGAVLEVELKGFALENAGVLGEEAKEDADEKAFEVVARVAAGFERVVKVAHDFGGFDVDGVLFLEFVLLVAGDEGEVRGCACEIRPAEIRWWPRGSCRRAAGRAVLPAPRSCRAMRAKSETMM